MVVTGIGVISAAGTGVEENWKRVVAGEPTAARDSVLFGSPVDFACRVPDFDPGPRPGGPQAERLDRYAQLAMVAAAEALASAGLPASPGDPDRCGIVLGSVAGGMGTLEEQAARLERGGPTAVAGRTMPLGLLSSAAGAISVRHGLRGTCLSVATACASGTQAIGLARDLVGAGTLDIALAGGADAPLTPFNAAAYARLRALSRRADDPRGASRPFSATRDGFVLGEGAGFLVLEREDDARARRAPLLAVVAGHAATADAHHAVRPDPTGSGARRAMLGALADADLDPGSVGHINAHGTSTLLNDAVEGTAIGEVFGDRVAVSSTKGVTGHTFGAAGALEAAYAVLALREGLIPPTANLTDPDPSIPVDLVAAQARRARLDAVMSNSFGFGGYNASLVLTTV
ncbi:beta-ketoacyl-[acyl-carrier-protein] synthase family protein [Streptomyces clavuligerus]|uniref:beta-ketoacyl-[acyl-carrier-protein] synthase family protein n=1 Tax=Streptomyces clavuligerus TaxID=1901 RepID=UPI000306D171|nr:beta-ketoacyl-[acyl-carrier-protein] synthase family protein [Streptomyces clavuligerus]MBY6307456.1 beta-ketoacyl-[acyl-carrier-protein] synthase family protein [Streptomyces clavuligerus]QCS09984.1 beta-ketoacyl-[acyl-carrier-protein] synthase family protein [Streptomyces clavuligerus]QPJ97973.1 beta-ketoacyl-ACP synthase II [Streptomyces clavuligerus]WDN56691.1 beta-ketoacyl-[acyl-carrier-protein] synthase family protein [Streptomyces clavuligerus]